MGFASDYGDCARIYATICIQNTNICVHNLSKDPLREDGAFKSSDDL